MQIVLLDQSTEVGQAPQYGGPISPYELARIAAALELQLNRDMSLFWDGAYRVRAGANAGDIQSGEIPALILDSLPDDPDAIAFHTSTDADQAIIELARNDCTNIMADSRSISSSLSHECLETAGDKPVNRWADDAKASSWALELSDAVEANWYSINGVAVSDFVLRSFFENGGLAPYSFMGTDTFASLVANGVVKAGDYSPAPAPFSAAHNGYQAVRQITTGVTQVWGRHQMRAHRLAHAKHPRSRIARRGVVI